MLVYLVAYVSSTALRIEALHVRCLDSICDIVAYLCLHVIIFHFVYVFSSYENLTSSKVLTIISR